MDHTGQKEQAPRLELVRTRLEKVEARTLEKSHQEIGRLRLNTDWNYKIRDKTRERVVLQASCRTWFVPEGYFEIYTEYTLFYRCRDDISMEHLERAMEKLLFPAGEHNAMLVAQITDKMRGSPLVLSPHVKLKDRDQPKEDDEE